jgi:hypothetical protein
MLIRVIRAVKKMSKSFESSRAPGPVDAFPHAKRVGDMKSPNIPLDFNCTAYGGFGSWSMVRARHLLTRP